MWLLLSLLTTATCVLTGVWWQDRGTIKRLTLSVKELNASNEAWAEGDIELEESYQNQILSLQDEIERLNQMVENRNSRITELMEERDADRIIIDNHNRVCLPIYSEMHNCV